MAESFRKMAKRLLDTLKAFPPWGEGLKGAFPLDAGQGDLPPDPSFLRKKAGCTFPEFVLIYFHREVAEARERGPRGSAEKPAHPQGGGEVKESFPCGISVMWGRACW